jgi:glycosyltransferase involved in cell wall biosynthesis
MNVDRIEGVSVLICTYNGAARLETTLAALSKTERNAIPAVELVVVDNASTDDTGSFVKKKWSELGSPFPLKLVDEAKPGKIIAQEKGLSVTQYKYVLICDDDNALFPDYLIKGYSLLKSNPGIGALGGQGIAVSDVPIPGWFKDFSYYYACAPQAPKTGDVRPNRNVIYGAGMFINTSAFAKAKNAGFKYLLPSRTGNTLVTGAEDGEVCWAIRFAGYEIWYSEELKFYHHLPPSRLTDEYRQRLLSSLNASNVAGKLYLRIFKGELTKPVRFFWLKELIYTAIYTFRLILKGVKENYADFQRSVNQMKYLLRERNNYDEALNYLLKLKSDLSK